MNANTLAARVREYLDAEDLLEERRAAGADLGEDAADMVLRLGERLREAVAQSGEAGGADRLGGAVERYLEMDAAYERARAGGRDTDVPARRRERARRDLDARVLAVASGADAPAVHAKGRPRVLIAVDASEPSDWAVEVGARLARALGAAVKLVHVVRPPVVAAEASLHAWWPVEADRREGESVLAEAARLLPPGVEAERALRGGLPAEEVADAAEEWGADLIVLGTHGRGSVARLVLGSTAEAVVRRAHCPVVTVGHEPRGDAIWATAGTPGDAVATSAEDPALVTAVGG